MMQEVDTPPSPEVVERLVAGHRDFLAFLEARLPDRQSAEEVLQVAFTRTLAKGGQLRDSESAVAWFYRLLRNALADFYRRRGAEQRAMERLSGELASVDAELRSAICACMQTLLPNLKPAYAEALQRLDLDQVDLEAFSAEQGITTNNATVRLHRARQALKRELVRSCGTCATHGCLDCSCGRQNPQQA